MSRNKLYLLNFLYIPYIYQDLGLGSSDSYQENADVPPWTVVSIKMLSS